MHTLAQNFNSTLKEVSRRDLEEREQYLKDLFEKVYFSDIIGRYHLRGVDEIGILTDVLASSVGSLTNTLKIQNTFLSERKSRISPTRSAVISAI